MNECEKYEELISSLIDSEISEEDRSALAQHLESCPRCRAMYESFMAVSELISDELEDVPRGMHENIMAQIRREDIKKKNTHRLSKPLKTLIATAACAAVIVGVGFVMKPGLKAPEAAISFSLSEEENGSADYAPEEAVSGLSEEPAEEEADMPAEAAMMSLPESEAAEAEADNSEGFRRGEVFSDKAAPQLSMQSPVRAPLSTERFEALMAMAGDIASDAEAEAVRESEIIIGLSCEDGRSVVFYDYESSLVYIVSSSESVFTAACEYSDILDFLNQNA